MVTLSTLPINSRGIIRLVDLDKKRKDKYAALGLAAGTKIKVRSTAQYGEYVEIQLKGEDRNSSIVIQKGEAIKILVTPI